MTQKINQDLLHKAELLDWLKKKLKDIVWILPLDTTEAPQPRIFQFGDHLKNLITHHPKILLQVQ